MKVLYASLVLSLGLAGCAAPPKIDRKTVYEGNTSPLKYRHVSGAPYRRNATVEVMGAVAGGLGHAAGQAAAGVPTASINTNEAAQAGIQGMPKPPAQRAVDCKSPSGAQP